MGKAYLSIGIGVLSLFILIGNQTTVHAGDFRCKPSLGGIFPCETQIPTTCAADETAKFADNTSCQDLPITNCDATVIHPCIKTALLSTPTPFPTSTPVPTPIPGLNCIQTDDPTICAAPNPTFKCYFSPLALPPFTGQFYGCCDNQPACNNLANYVPTPTSLTPTPKALFSGLTDSVLAVQCPPDTTFISIFDACLDFATTLGWGMNWALIIASVLAMVRFAIGAQQLIFSQGDPGKLQSGRETITDAILGLVLLSIAWIVFGYLNATLPESWQIDLFTVFG